MIRFVDLTSSYWTEPEAYSHPVCAFLSTTSNCFLTTLDGSQVFYLDDVREHEERDRLFRLLPPGFFGDKGG